MASRTTYIASAVAGVLIVSGAAWWLNSRSAGQAGAPGEKAAAGAAARGASGAQGPATLVTIAAAQKQDVPVDVTVNGNVVSLNSVELKPQVGNVIQKVHVK